MEVKQPFSDDIGDLLAPCGLANLKKNNAIIVYRQVKFPNSHHCSLELQQANMVCPGETKLCPEREKRS